MRTDKYAYYIADVLNKVNATHTAITCNSALRKVGVMSTISGDKDMGL